MSLTRSTLGLAVGALNRLGHGLEAVGIDVPRRDVDSLIATARRRSGLAHLGEWPITGPLGRLLDAYEREADLTLLGKITVKELLVSLLENLLHLEAERAAAPELTDERIEAPVFIIGLPRTGTTLLHNLMAEDRTNRVPRTWEVMFPARHDYTPAAVAATRAQTARRLAWANRLAPEFKRIHAIAPDLPQECIAITAQVFMSIQFHTTHNVPSYENWLEGVRQTLSYDFHHRFLQHLQHRQRASRWVLKAPGHLFALDALLARYPDAKIIQTHRDPLRVMASMASHATVLRRAFSDRADPKAIAADWSDRWAKGLEHFLRVRDESPAAQFLDVSYGAIEAAPIETIETIYRFIGAPLEDEARARMAAHLARNPKHKHGVHRYSLAQYGLDRDTELARFKSYCERFDIPVQV
jgi:Sulfotransferase family